MLVTWLLIGNTLFGVGVALVLVMDRLSHDDLATVLEVVTQVNQAHDREEFLRTALAGTVRAVPCTVATVNEVDPSAGRFHYWMEPASFPLPDNAREIFARLAHEHPLLNYTSATGDGSAKRVSDFWSTEEFHRSRIYQQIYRPMGVEYQVAITLSAPKPTVVALALSREDEDFSERDQLVLDVLRPHFAQAWRSASDRERLAALLEAAARAIGEQGWGVVLLSEPPEEVTPGALATLSRYFGAPAVGEALPAPILRWLEDLGRETSPAQPLELKRPLSSVVEGGRLVARYLGVLPGQAGAIVLRERGLADQRERFEALALTRREAEIVRLVTTGASNVAIALSLEISPGTVKKHLDNIYAKLGVSGRGALTALVLDIV